MDWEGLKEKLHGWAVKLKGFLVKIKNFIESLISSLPEDGKDNE